MKPIKEVEYKGHELIVLQDNIDQSYTVDVREDNHDGPIIAGYTQFDTIDDAIRVGQIFVDGYVYRTVLV